MYVFHKKYSVKEERRQEYEYENEKREFDEKWNVGLLKSNLSKTEDKEKKSRL